jgi:hypothetical protein
MANYAVPAPDDAPSSGYAVPAPDDAQPQASWQAQVKPAQTYNGKQSVLRSDGAVWYGPEQGNTGAPGWFDAQGNRASDAPGQSKPTLSTLGRLGSEAAIGATSWAPALAGHILSGFGLFPNKVAQSQTDLANQANQYGQELENGTPSALGLPSNAPAKSLHGFGTAANLAGQLVPMALAGEVTGVPALTRAAMGYLPEATTALGRLGTSLAGGAIGGGLFGGITAPAMQPTPEGQSYGGAAAQNILPSAAMGAFVPGGLSALSEGPEIIGQGMRRVLGTPAERQAALDLALSIRSATGAEPSLGESLQNPTLKHVENASEYVPMGGRGTQLKANNAALQGALQAEVDANTPALGPTGAGDMIANSAKAGLSAKRAPAIQLYNEVRASAGSAKPTVDNTLDAYDDAIAQESGISGADSPQTKLLQAERDKLASGETAPTYNSLEKMQDRQQSQAANNFNAPSQEAQDVAHYRSEIGKAMGADLHATANAVDPALGDKYAQANNIYAESYNYDPNASTDWQESKQRSMNRILHGQEGATTTLPDQLFRGDNPDMAAHAAETLTPEGQAAVKAAIWDRINKAANTTSQGGTSKSQVFSPAKASGAIDDHANFIKQFFSPDEQNDIFGLRDAFRTMQRSGQYMESLQTGKFVPAIAAATGLPSAAGLALAGHPATLGMELGTMGAARGYNALSGTPGGKNWLLNPGGAPTSVGTIASPQMSGLTTLARPRSQQEYDALPPETPYQGMSGTPGMKLSTIPQYDPQSGFEKFTTQDVDPSAISKGLIEKGNIPLVGRPLVAMGRGSVGSEYSYTIDDNGAKVLIPSIFDGAPHTAQQAIAHYRTTGQHLGKWNNEADAAAAAEIIHNRENRVLYQQPGVKP